MPAYKQSLPLKEWCLFIHIFTIFTHTATYLYIYIHFHNLLEHHNVGGIPRIGPSLDVQELTSRASILPRLYARVLETPTTVYTLVHMHGYVNGCVCERVYGYACGDVFGSYRGYSRARVRVRTIRIRGYVWCARACRRDWVLGVY